MQYIIYIIVCVVGIIIGYWIRKQQGLFQINSAESKAVKILDETKIKQKELLLQAQDKALKIIDDAKQENKYQQTRINNLQTRLEQREIAFSQKLLDLQEKQQRLYDKVNRVEAVKEKIKQIKKEQLDKLEKIASMSKQDAQKALFKNIEQEVKDDLIVKINKLEKESSDILNQKAINLMADAMQRLASSCTVSLSTTVVSLPDEEMKGRIIGREGRNIKTIEQLTGVEIIVDDTPNAITISGFSPLRRHLTKKVLEYLIKDGRIHPTKIEEAVQEAKKEIIFDIKKSGEEAMYELGITGFDPKLIQILGRLKYRISYGQNVLQHSLEVAHLSVLLAEELRIDTALAKKAGLLHDIGKSVDHEVQGTHPVIGGDIARKFNLPQEIINPIETHHDDRPADLLSIIVKTADAISSSRLGARHDTYEHYIQRLEELEKIATSFEGIDKAYAIQAGREVRVFVSADKIDDLMAYKIAKNVANKIEKELNYPGEIKVTVIREMRAIEYAR